MQLCGIEFTDVNQQAVQLTYTPSYDDCVIACVELDTTAPCVGLQYDVTTEGPGGNLCYLLWSLAGPKDNQLSKLILGISQPSSNAVTVFRL
jgi:hypothetical protein